MMVRLLREDRYEAVQAVSGPSSSKAVWKILA